MDTFHKKNDSEKQTETKNTPEILERLHKYGDMILAAEKNSISAQARRILEKH